MSNSANLGLAANIILLAVNLMSVAHAQRPPETDATGAAYLRVNINPTNVPPMVNINPNDTVPHMNVDRMPELRVTATGCQNRQNFRTGVGRSVAGPLMITYLHLPQQTTVTLGDTDGSHSMNLGPAGQITTAIYLQTNQRLEFDSEIMYSGCRPD